MGLLMGHFALTATFLTYSMATEVLLLLTVNPGHWTVDMRDDALEPAKLNDPGLKVLPLRTMICVKQPEATHFIQPTPGAGGGRRRRDRLLHTGHCQGSARAQRDAHRPVAAPAG